MNTPRTAQVARMNRMALTIAVIALGDNPPAT